MYLHQKARTLFRRTAQCVLPVLILLPLCAQPIQAQQSKLLAGDGAAGDEFGNAVALAGDFVVVGVRQDDDAGDRSGAAYVFARDGATWAQQTKLTAGDAASGDAFGTGVGVSGDYAVAGAPGSNGTGAAYVFRRDGATWAQQARLTADDAAAGDNFGSSVAVSGDYLVVSATGDDDAGDGSGAAYVFVRDGTNWTQQAKLTASDARSNNAFGSAVSISGDYLVVGALGENLSSERSGSAYVFRRDGATWTQQALLRADDGAFGDQFGNAVSLEGADLAVGMHLDDDGGEDAGSAYVFRRADAVWVQQARLTADDAAAGDAFGTAVAISGDRAVVGAPGSEDAGAVYVFERTGTTWTQQARLTSGDIASEDDFGNAVALSDRFAVVAARKDDDRGSRSGAAYVFALGTLAAPQLSAPTDGAAGLPSSVLLAWEAVDGADSYRVQVAATTAFASPVVDASDLAGTSYQAEGLAAGTTYYWRVAAINAAGTSAWSNVRRFTVGAGTGVERTGDDVPTDYNLSQNYPNPFNPTTTIAFDLPEASRVTLDVYDAAGNAITTLVNGLLSAGRYTVTWQAEGLASGVYLYRLRAGTFSATKKVTLLR